MESTSISRHSLPKSQTKKFIHNISSASITSKIFPHSFTRTLLRENKCSTRIPSIKNSNKKFNSSNEKIHSKSSRKSQEGEEQSKSCKKFFREGPQVKVKKVWKPKEKILEDDFPIEDFSNSEDSEISILEENFENCNDSSSSQDDLEQDFDDVPASINFENSQENEFCLEDAVRVLKEKSVTGMTKAEFVEIFLPKKNGNFTRYFYMRKFEQILEEC